MRDLLHRGVAAALLAVLAATGCSRLDHVERRTVAPDSLLLATAPTSDAGPIKAHMPDGSVYVFSSWSIFADDRRITGQAAYLGPGRDTLAHGSLSVALDSVALVETNVLTSSAAPVYFGVLTAASAVLTVYCLTTPKACFGSCPTIYSATPDGHVLEAESFSHSVAPLFEMRDVDRIGAQPDAAGVVRLEVRNEALETHYINHLELLEVAHERGAYVVPQRGGGAFVMSDWATDLSIKDRAGNDVAERLSRADGSAYESDPSTLESATADDAFDFFDVTLPAPPSDSAAVLLRLRASLLSTVLFYDFMLAGQGVDAIDWLSRTLQTIAGAVEIGEFYTRWMGVRVSVHDGESFREAGRIGGAGPIAWDDAALVVPVPEPDSLRLRISFLTDAFRIDRLAVAHRVERRPARTIPLAGIESSTPSNDALFLADASQPDEHYFATYPGTRFDAVFDVESARKDTARDASASEQGSGDAGTPLEREREGSTNLAGARDASAHTYFLASQGYYIEWIRREWMQRDTTGMPVLASDEMLRRAFERWRTVKSDYEDLFFRTKIPVR